LKAFCIRAFILLAIGSAIGYFWISEQKQSKVTVPLLEGRYPDLPGEEVYRNSMGHTSYGGIDHLDVYYSRDYMTSKGTAFFNPNNDMAIECWRKRDYHRFDSLLDVAIKQRNPVAMYNKSARRSDQDALLKRAATMNYPVAITEYCLFTYKNKSPLTYNDYQDILSTMKKASSLGDGKASFVCGNIYKYMSQTDKAKEYWLLGAKQGYEKAMRYYLQEPDTDKKKLLELLLSEYSHPDNTSPSIG
jgi:hypothetical protein